MQRFFSQFIQMIAHTQEYLSSWFRSFFLSYFIFILYIFFADSVLTKALALISPLTETGLSSKKARRVLGKISFPIVTSWQWSRAKTP